MQKQRKFTRPKTDLSLVREANLLTVAEAATVLGLSPATLADPRNGLGLKRVKIGRKPMIPLSSVRACIAAHVVHVSAKEVAHA